MQPPSYRTSENGPEAHMVHVSFSMLSASLDDSEEKSSFIEVVPFEQW